MTLACRAPIVVATVLLALAPAGTSAQIRPAAERQGTFSVSGRLLLEDRSPALNMEVVAAVVDDAGNPMLTTRRTPDGRWTVWAGSARTDAQGKFRLLVDRSHFEGSKIRFAILARPVGSDQNHGPATTPVGAMAVFVVGEADSDLPNVGDILVRR